MLVTSGQGVRRVIMSASTVVGALSARSVWVSNLPARSCTLSVQECGGLQICQHDRQGSGCKECGGSQICEHGRQRRYCKECVGLKSASTVVSATDARSAVGARP